MILNQFENSTTTLNVFLKALKVPVSKYTIQQKVEEHPNPESILCISDCLNEWHTPNAVIETKKEHLTELPLPFVTTIKDGDNTFFTVIKECSTSSLTYFSNKKQKYVKTNTSDFLEYWGQVVLIAEPNINSGETQYRKNKYRHLAYPCCIYLMILLLLILASDFHLNSSTTYTLLTFIAAIIGLTSSVLLQLQEIRQVPFVERICSLLAKGNCHSVTNSKGAKLFSILSWSDIGFMYFTGYIINSLINPYSFIINCISVHAVVYILYSILYQWLYVKQWCILCLIVLFTLSIQGIISFIMCLNNIQEPTITDFAYVFSAFAIATIICYIEKNTMVKISNLQIENRRLKYIKYNTTCFNSLLDDSLLEKDKIPHGIILGKKEGYSHSIIAVCNPYCSPCAKAHIALNKLIELYNEIQVKIIFTTPGNHNESSAYKMIEYFLNIQEQGNQSMLADAVTYWYNNNDKNNCIDIIKERYPVKIDPTISIEEEIKRMHNWADEVGIVATPTIYFNGRKLSREFYSIDDLKYFIN